MLEAVLNRVETWEFKDQLVEAGLLTEFHPECLTDSGKVIFTCCGDGNHFLQMTSFLGVYCGRRGAPKPHPIGQNHGGAIYHARPATLELILPPEVARAAEEFKVVARQLKEALDMHKGDTYLDTVHWSDMLTYTCAKANGNLGLSVLEQMYLAVDARDHFAEFGINPERINIGILFARKLPGGKIRRRVWKIAAERWKREAPPIPELRYQFGRGLTCQELWPS